jgi:hypothetical protein
MVKIRIDDDVSMLTNKQLKINILQFLDNYKNILVNNILLNYDDEYIKKDIRYLKKQFVVMKKQIKTAEIETIYGNLMQHNNKQTPSKPGPWRITFDTNPDHCNFKCVMCECFSPYSTVKKDRVANRIKKRIMPIETIEKVLAESVGTPLKEIIRFQCH